MQRRQLPATITPSSEEQEDEGSVQTASAVEAPDGSLGAGADDPAEATVTHVSTIAGVIGEEDTTKLFTVTSTETKQSTSTGTAHDADGNTGSSSSDDSESTHAGLIAGLVVGLSVIVLVLALLVWQRWRKGKASTDLHTPTSDRDSFIAEGKDGQGSGSGTLATAAISQPIATEKPSLQKAVTPPPEVRKRPAKGKRKDSSQTNRQSWFSLKSHRTLNNAFNYYRRSTGLDGDEELKELPPTTNYAAMYERSVLMSTIISFQ